MLQVGCAGRASSSGIADTTNSTGLCKEKGGRGRSIRTAFMPVAVPPCWGPGQAFCCRANTGRTIWHLQVHLLPKHLVVCYGLQCVLERSSSHRRIHFSCSTCLCKYQHSKFLAPICPSSLLLSSSFHSFPLVLWVWIRKKNKSIFLSTVQRGKVKLQHAWKFRPLWDSAWSCQLSAFPWTLHPDLSVAFWHSATLVQHMLGLYRT